jgi:hypothetical protein
MNNIVLVSRGGCSFVTKVRNLQSSGAQAVLIADNLDEDSSKITMQNDGSA